MTKAKKKSIAKKIELKAPVLKQGKQYPAIDYGAHGKAILTPRSEKSMVGNRMVAGTSAYGMDRIEPRVPFWKRHEFYLSVGRVQNVTEMYVLNIINREWYYDSEDQSKDIESKIKLMEKWEETVVATKFLGMMTRSWIVDGVFIVSPKDWLPLQLQSIRSKTRDEYGKTLKYYQYINGQEKPIPAADFLEEPYIDFDREPWPTGMFDSLMNSEYVDIDGHEPRASLELYRQALQDNMKIHHKFASPRVYYVPEVGQTISQTQLDKDIVPVIESMLAGDRAAFTVALKIIQESVDGNARFIEHVNKIIDEIDTGLQSSANRLITEPSAMADAREAGFQDDDRVLGIMEKIRIFMNKEVIPRVCGTTPGEIEFKWGNKSAFDLELPEPIEKALNLRLITAEKALLILEKQYHWKIPTDEEVMERFHGQPAVPLPEEEKPQEKPAIESVKMEKDDSARRLHNEKIILYTDAQRKIKEI